MKTKIAVLMAALLVLGACAQTSVKDRGDGRFSVESTQPAGPFGLFDRVVQTNFVCSGDPLVCEPAGGAQ